MGDRWNSYRHLVEKYLGKLPLKISRKCKNNIKIDLRKVVRMESGWK
jgi:hypothetical protein